MKTEILLPDPLVVAADAYAQQAGISRDELFARAVERYLAAERYDGVTAALDDCYAGEASDLEPALQAAQTRALAREDW